MAKKTKNESSPNEESPSVRTHVGLQPVNIAEEMRTAYLDYAMSAITSSALPAARAGLKPVHRRHLFFMNSMGLSPGAKFRNPSTIVVYVLRNYHTPPDSSL